MQGRKSYRLPFRQVNYMTYMICEVPC